MLWLFPTQKYIPCHVNLLKTEACNHIQSDSTLARVAALDSKLIATPSHAAQL